MNCIIDFDGTRFNFTQNKYKQKMLIETLLHYEFNLSRISQILNVPISVLEEVHKGVSFLPREIAQNLGQLFLLFFSNPGR